MDSQTAARVIATAVSARAALDSLLLELTSEVEAAERAGELTPDEAAPAGTIESSGTTECQHSNKTQMVSFGSLEHWVCSDCGYEYRR